MNYFNKLSENLYFKLSGGFLEYMFAAAGGEILWRPFYKNYGIGMKFGKQNKEIMTKCLTFRL